MQGVQGMGLRHPHLVYCNYLGKCCKLKNPLQFKTAKCYQIIHKVERQLLYDRVRSINRLLENLEKHQFINYTCLREVISEDDLFICIWFINKIKEHRHIKTKNRQIDKFKWVLIKSGCHHNQQPSLDNCPPQTLHSMIQQM